MKALFLSGREAERHILRLMRECVRYSCAVAWATRNAVTDAIEKNASRSEYLVIGTHLYQTCPTLLGRFSGLERARVMAPHGDLFHPKVYVFDLRTRIAAVVGSHNLTAAAFGRNVEASVLLDGAGSEPVIRDLQRFVESSWRNAEAITDDFLFAYRRQHHAKMQARSDLERFVRIARPRRSEDVPILDLSWPQLVAAVGVNKHHTLEGRLDLLDEMRRLFAAHRSLEKMGVADRLRVAGTEGKRARRMATVDSGWFGAMSGFGDFAHLVREKPEGLSHALDAIPLTGPVAASAYATFVRRFRRAFEGLSRMGNVSSGTRLLAMKRPDVFLCFNDANQKPLCHRLGVAPTTVTLDNYWDRIVEPIKASRWWIEPEPENARQNRIWRGRAALLDAIYYEPV